MKTQAQKWEPKAGIAGCYTGTRSRVMRRHHQVRVLAEARGHWVVVAMLNKQGKATGGAIAVKAKHVAPIQGDFFVRVIH